MKLDWVLIKKNIHCGSWACIRLMMWLSVWWPWSESTGHEDHQAETRQEASWLLPQQVCSPRPVPDPAGWHLLSGGSAELHPAVGAAVPLPYGGDTAVHHQDQNLSVKVKKKTVVPLMFIIQNTIVFDKSSPKTIAFVKSIESDQLVSVHEKESIKQLKEEQGLVKNIEQRRKKCKKISGSNPLSCLKKKKNPEDTKLSASEKKRKRIRIWNRSTSEELSEKQNAEG
uniref:Uncharacterized protein n=1 Tax=Sciurus vulgaris TaxID=55149 RepID=A0A8D2CR05_SCIVU